MSPDSPPESSYQLWIHDCIKRYFRARDFEVRSITVTTQKEKHLPFDVHVQVRKGDFVKRFGLQVKRPYLDNKKLSWRLKREQHETLGDFPWIYYALPTFVDATMQEVSCYHIMIVGGGFQFKSVIGRKDVPVYYRWGGFTESLEKCAVGETVAPEAEFLSAVDFVEELRLKNSVIAEIDYTEKLINVVKSPESEEDE